MMRFMLCSVALILLLVSHRVAQMAIAADPLHPVPAALKEPPPTAFECRWADSPINIDGNASDPAWKHAQEISSFYLPWLGNKARLARTATTARLLWDREFLYFHADMTDSDLLADITTHDGALWNNDVFELFFRPDADKSGYYEFQASAAGARFDAFYPKHDPQTATTDAKSGSFRWEAKVRLRGKLNSPGGQANGWSVEGRIPWTDFMRTGGRPVPEEIWKLNLCRYDYNKNWTAPELSCIAPIHSKKIGAFFHQTEDYASIAFKGPNNITAAPFGIAKRDPLTTSTVIGFPDAPPPYRSARTLDAHLPEFPICARMIPGTDEMLLISQPAAYANSAVFRLGTKGIKTPASAVKLLDTPGGGTAYDIAFHPNWKNNGFVYFGWNGKIPGKEGKHSAISRYTMTTKPPFVIDPATNTTIIAWPSDGHNGAAVCFGRNGLMFVTSGDGTSDSDGNLMGQRTDSLLAKVLRIDVDHPEPGKMYSVPKDNPFVGNKDFVGETWAYGLRAPWRITYDHTTDQLWVCQNGQDLWEQAYLVRKGENYGWSVMEGSHPFYPNRKPGPTPFTKPTVEHHHSEARSLTGGLVYHGNELSDLKGAYIYGDYSTGHIWAVKHDGTRMEWHKKIAITNLKITGFAIDSTGELLVLHHAAGGEGGFFKLVPNKAQQTAQFPRTLSASGLFDSVKDHRMKPGVIPYSVNAPFWSDGLHKERFVAVPEGTVPFNRSRSWDFPDKTVLVKSFALEMRAGDPSSRKWIETRFMTRQDGEWYGYSYQWNPEGTDATLLGASGTDASYQIANPSGVRDFTWHYPSRAECMVCHSRAANFVLGLSEAQLNKNHTYPGGCTDNQLRAMEHIGLLNVNWSAEVPAPKDAIERQQPNQRTAKSTTMLPFHPSGLKRLANPYDKAEPLDQRAKAWLHTNCATCHVEAGGGNAQFKLDIDTPWDQMRLIDVKPQHQSFNLPEARLIAPGSPERSILIHRIGARGHNSGQMPPISSSLPDTAGVALMTEWCRSLKKAEAGKP